MHNMIAKLRTACGQNNAAKPHSGVMNENRYSPAANRVSPVATKKARKALLAGTVALLIGGAGIAWIVAPKSSESTDNAYLKADSVSVTPRVGGFIAAVLVPENQPVKAGTPLIRIDAREFDARLTAARAAVADAVAGVATTRAALGGLGADEQLAAARIRATRSMIATADAEQIRAAADKARFDALVADGFATKRDAERVRATAIGASSALERSRADRDVSQEQARVTQARRPVLAAEVARAVAVEARARAALVLAEQDRGYTLLRAPIDGVTGNRQAQVGDFVQPGMKLMTLVPARGLDVVANFKETQTRRMLIGQKAEVEIDALGGDALHGEVESLAPASGSEFTLLPFEPGSGNFTKIVQRVPVRIRLDPGQAAVARLRPGLSATATVRLD